MAFKSIYFTKDLSLKSLISVLGSLSIVLIIGLPLIFIRIILAYVKVRSIDDLWEEVSPFKNLKLLIRNGKIIRNMKKFAENGKIYNEVVNMNIPVKQGLIALDKGTHAVSFVEGLGVTYTTKTQKHKEALINESDGTFSYAQGFGKNTITPKSEIKKEKLIQILEKRYMESIYSHSRILEIKQKEIVFNEKNKQFSRHLTKSEIDRSEAFLNKCGGVDKINRAFEYYRDVSKLLESAERMLYVLSNSDPSSIPKKYMENKEIHDILIGMEKAGQLNKNDKLFKIKNKIEEIVDVPYSNGEI